MCHKILLLIILKICLLFLPQQDVNFILFESHLYKVVECAMECIIARCTTRLINFGYKLEASFTDIVFLKYLKSILSYRKIMARDYDWENISKVYTVLSQQVIITRS